MQQFTELFPTVRGLRSVVLPAVWMLAVFGSGRATAFGFDDVAREADRVARAPYRKPPAADPALVNLSYDAYRQLRFRPEYSTWRDGSSAFELQYFPLGRGFSQPLTMYEVVDDVVRPLKLPAGAFEGTRNAGIAGWRLHRWAGQPRRSDEVIAFLGASYFRAIADNLAYGMSVRGLAVDTVGGSVEEFPVFTTYWMQRPKPGDDEVRFFALLESPRVTGAYGFVVRPNGPTTSIDVRARLTLRAPVVRLGIAPLTSMFLAGEIQPMIDDYRPEVHDSDGLQVATGSGEWIWRPLINPAGVFVTSFSMPSLRGFGLMQRDRSFTSYQDLEARYDKRPSAWVDPLNDWGPGRVELLQYYTPNETHDNIGAWWFPDRLPALGEAVEYAWRVTVSDRQPMPPQAWVAQSRRGHGYREAAFPEGHMQYHVDFAGPALDGLRESDVEAVASGDANLRDLRVIAHPNTVLGGWRVTLDFQRIDRKKPVELRLFLRSGSRTLSETWSLASAPE